MKNIFFSSNFNFNLIKFNKYHYTDNRKGSQFNYLAYMLKGHCKIISDRKSITVHEGEVFYIPINLSYQSYWYGNYEIKFLSFGFSQLHTGEESIYELQTIPCDKTVLKKLLNIETGTNNTCRSLSIFYDVMADLIPHMKHVKKSKDEIIVANVKNYIKNNFNCSMSEVAKACSISEPYLYVLFKRVMHQTPNEYRQRLLCEKGIELLRTTDKTVEEISNILNFSSGSYFRKVLKKHTNSTPRKIRKNNII